MCFLCAKRPWDHGPLSSDNVEILEGDIGMAPSALRRFSSCPEPAKMQPLLLTCLAWRQAAFQRNTDGVMIPVGTGVVRFCDTAAYRYCATWLVSVLHILQISGATFVAMLRNVSAKRVETISKKEPFFFAFCVSNRPFYRPMPKFLCCPRSNNVCRQGCAKGRCRSYWFHHSSCQKSNWYAADEASAGAEFAKNKSFEIETNPKLVVYDPKLGSIGLWASKSRWNMEAHRQPSTLYLVSVLHSLAWMQLRFRRFARFCTMGLGYKTL